MIKDSPIEGKGVFANESIQKNEIVWMFDPGHDKTLSKEDYENLSDLEKEKLQRIAYLSQTSGLYVLPPEGDAANYTNHDSENNNLSVVIDISLSTEPYFVANRKINTGEELTNNYNEFDKAIKSQPFVQDWLKKF